MPPDSPDSPGPRTARTPRSLTPVLVLVGSLALSGIGAYEVDRAWKENEQAHYRAALDGAAAEIRDRIAQRREAYVAILHGTTGLFAGDRYVPPPVFIDYVRSLKLQQSYPGVQGLGVILKAMPADLEKIEAYLASVGLPRRVWPADPPRDLYYPVIHLEPLDSANRAVLGFDVYTDPARREALERARDEGTVGITAKVRLKQDFGPGVPPRDGFVMYYPIYGSKNRSLPTTTEQRRERIVAFVTSPFIAEDFLQGIFPSGRPASMEFDLYDGTKVSAEHLLSGGATSRAEAVWPVGEPLTLDMGGRTWTLAFRTDRPPPAATTVSPAAMAVLATGGAISVLLFALSRSQLRARRTAERAAAELGAAAEQLRRRAEERIGLLAAEREARADAEAANRSKDEFLATLSHELRTPLNAILGWAQLLRTGALPADESTEGLATIERNAKAQAQLVDDLLDLSRIISGKLRVEARPVDLVEVIQAALASVRPPADAKGITVVPVLDALAGPVVGDAGRLQQVAWNLLSNAIKFTPRGGRVDVCLRSTPSDAEITVSDDGAGIRDEFLPHVFDRLRQADGSSTRRHGGLGLGLAIVRHLVELHGGTVSASSAGEGKGASFTVRLPLAGLNRRPRPEGESGPRTDPGEQRQVETDVALTPSPDRVLEGVRVLVVDDEPDAREVIRLGFEQRGAMVVTAASAAEAIAQIESGQDPANLLVCDIGMPDEDGYALIRRVRRLSDSIRASVPAVALTAYARAEDRQRALEAGFDEHVPKPVEPSEFAAAVAELLRRTTRPGRAGADLSRL